LKRNNGCQVSGCENWTVYNNEGGGEVEEGGVRNLFSISIAGLSELLLFGLKE
jgi:hypothetical protein